MPLSLKKGLKRLYYSPYANPFRPLYYTGYFFNWYFRPRVCQLVRKTFGTGEITNFTYDLTPKNLDYLAHMTAFAARRSRQDMADYIAEARNDVELKQHVVKAIRSRGQPVDGSVECMFGRRLGWYALVRALRPKVVVETGVERGHGAVLLCAALLRNAAEGHPGRYYGLDIDPGAGWLLTGKYAQAGKVLYGDSLESLAGMKETIDLFINDSDHSADYEAREYLAIEPKLSAGAVILGDNAHVTDKLAAFSQQTGRNFLFFREEPADHWYTGAGIGISFPA
jgi:predicted O-methyltransferase YrrM